MKLIDDGTGEELLLYNEKLQQFVDSLVEDTYALSDVVKIDRWISVEDRYPDDYDKGYLIAFVTGSVGYALYNDACGFYSAGCYNLNVTHWMPLPSHPKNLKENEELK